MDKQDVMALLQVINGLGSIPVAGKGYMTVMVNCIGRLEQMAGKYGKESEEE